MSRNPQEFAELLTSALWTIKAQTRIKLDALQDELGYGLGKTGGEYIRWLRRGNIPADADDVVRLAHDLGKRGGLDWQHSERLLRYAGLTDIGAAMAGWRNTANLQVEDEERGNQSMHGVKAFTARPPVQYPRQFFGRERELRRIFGCLHKYPLEHVALIGPKRSGKSSLLLYLRAIGTADPATVRPGQRQDWLPQPARYRWVYVSFTALRLQGQGALCQRLLRHLCSELGLPLAFAGDLDRFMDAAAQANRRDVPTVVLMDDIDTAVASPGMDEFWEAMRAFLSSPDNDNVALIVASHTPPLLLAAERGHTSPLFNLFHTVELGPYPPKEARELIASSPLPFPEADVDWVLAQSRCWPYLLQILCQERLSALENGEEGEGWKQAGVARIAPYGYLLDAK